MTMGSQNKEEKKEHFALDHFWSLSAVFKAFAH